jgi:heat shock protein HslJ
MRLILIVPLLLAACAVENPAGGDAALQSNAAERTSDPVAVVGKTWYWISTVTPVERIEVNDPGRYTLLLHSGGEAELQVDCNRGRGAYTLGAGTLAMGPLISTRMACPEDTMDHVFLRQLENAAGFFVEGGYLFIDQKMDSGTMRFSMSPETAIP